MMAAVAVAIPFSGQSAQTGYFPANAAGCKVWQPPQLRQPEFLPKYTGACKDGVASGKGHLEWINKYASMRVSATWDGYFANGVYVGATPLHGSVEPLERSGEYLVRLGAVKEGDVIVFATNNRDGEMDLCGTQMIGVSLNAKTPATDDAAVKEALTDAAHSLGAVCPTTPRPTVQVNAYAEPFKIDEHGQRTLQIADARLNWETHELSGYSNSASAKVKSQQRGAAQAAKLADERQRFDAFSKKNGITAWVLTSQLDANPFKYEGKTVGLVVHLDRMVTRDTGVVSGAAGDDGGSVQLHGINPDFPDSDHAVMLAVKVGKREPFADDANKTPAITGVVKADSFACAEEGCDDVLGWAERGPERIAWGAPYTPRQ